jgi:hypothetical protein
LSEVWVVDFWLGSSTSPGHEMSEFNEEVAGEEG